jgi:hypothetical protein
MNQLACKKSEEILLKINQNLSVDSNDILPLIGSVLDKELDLYDRVSLIHLARGLSSPAYDGIKKKVAEKLWPYSEVSVIEAQTLILLFRSFKSNSDVWVKEKMENLKSDVRADVRNQAKLMLS